MKGFRALSSKGQLKIQQMAFVLLAFMIFFGLIALFYISLKTRSLSSDVSSLRSDELRLQVQKMAGTPELAWTQYDCAGCIDLDKAFSLNKSNAEELWGKSAGVLQIQKIYPVSEDRECSRSNYPDCSTITLFDKNLGFTSVGAFVALCRYSDGVKCELGKIIIGVANAE